jgi:proline dehydrogenase
MDQNLLSRYIAGASQQEALERARHLNKEGIGTLLAPLPISASEGGSLSARVGALTELARQMGMKMIRGGISLRLSDLGFRDAPSDALDAVSQVIRAGEEFALACWIEMEEGDWVDPILEAYFKLRKSFPHLSITLQSCLDRTSSDLRKVVAARGRIRLVKGYHLPGLKTTGSRDPDEIRRRYMGDMELLFSEGAMFAIATHDETIIQAAAKLQSTHPRMMEFQMYMGVREERIRTLLYEGGFPVTLYLPYGTDPGHYIDRARAIGDGTKG